MPELSKDDVDMAKLQQALSTKRRELVAAGMGGLSADQLQTFWAVYGDFEKEKDAEHGGAARTSSRTTPRASRRCRMPTSSRWSTSRPRSRSRPLDLRMKYFGIINQKLGAKAAGRFAHIDDYLTTIGRLSILDNMPALQVGK